MQLGMSSGAIRHRERNRLMAERREQRTRKVRIRLDRMPEETAEDYIAHYEQYGIEHFTPSHCPAKFRAAVVAHFGRAA